MADFVSHENRVRLFLAFLIIVLVIVNSQSLHFSHTSRKILTTAFDEAARSKAELMASRLAGLLATTGNSAGADRFRVSAALSKLLQELAEKHGAGSACLLDWNGRILAGSSDCRLSDVLDFDRLDRVGKYQLVDRGWSMTEVSPAYQPESATAFGYLALKYPDGTERGVLRLQFSASSLAEANRGFRSTLVYQVSALSLVLLTLVLFLNGLLAPHRRLLAEARSVAGDLTSTSASADEGQFLLSTFQECRSEAERKGEAARRDASNGEGTGG